MLVLCCGGGLTGLKVSRCLCTNMIGDVSEHQMLNLYIFIVNIVNIVTNIQHCISHRAMKNSHKNFLFVILCLFSHIILHHFPLLSLYCDDYVCSPISHHHSPFSISILNTHLTCEMISSNLLWLSRVPRIYILMKHCERTMHNTERIILRVFFVWFDCVSLPFRGGCMTLSFVLHVMRYSRRRCGGMHHTYPIGGRKFLPSAII